MAIKDWRSWLQELSLGQIFSSTYKLVIVGAEGVGKEWLLTAARQNHPCASPRRGEARRRQH